MLRCQCVAGRNSFYNINFLLGGGQEYIYEQVLAMFSALRSTIMPFSVCEQVVGHRTPSFLSDSPGRLTSVAMYAHVTTASLER